MPQKEINITIENGGKMTVEKKGFMGTECKEALKNLGDLVKIIERKPTKDMRGTPQKVRERQSI